MKKVIVLIVGVLFLYACIANAASTVTLEWDAVSASDLAGYREYQSQTSGVYTFGDGHQVATVPAGTETVTIEGLPDGTYYWVVTAYDTNGNESGPSNEVTATLDSTAPDPPINHLITAVEKIIAALQDVKSYLVAQIR